MNPDKVRKLEQMGLGPVWQLRSPPAADAGAALPEFAGAEPVPASGSAARVPAPAHAPALADDIAGMDWEALEASIRQCTRCRLCEGRQHAVPGTGDRNARWLFVGEGPGRNEDLQGEPFVGPAGQLLDNMMRALDLARGENTYIANIVKCRPVGPDGRDRPPAADEVSACLPYLQRQIALIQPDVIVALGKTAAVSLLGLPEDTTLGSLRGQPGRVGDVPLVITYHPAYLLRKPADKAKTWRDLCVAQAVANGR